MLEANNIELEKIYLVNRASNYYNINKHQELNFIGGSKPKLKNNSKILVR